MQPPGRSSYSAVKAAVCRLEIMHMFVLSVGAEDGVSSLFGKKKCRCADAGIAVYQNLPLE
jgi:hypothetical protein